MTAMATFVVATAPVAQANWFGATGLSSFNCSDSTGNMTDSTTHTYHMNTTWTTQNVEDAMNWHLPRLASEYGMTVQEHSSNNTNTDIVVFDADYTTQCGLDWDASPGNKVGLAKCVNHWNATQRCDRHYLRFDTSDTNNFSAAKNRKLACHETGHALGLKHRFRTSDPGCMRSSLGAATTNYYSAHDQSHFSSL